MDSKVKNSFFGMLWLFVVFELISCSSRQVLVDDYVKDAILVGISASTDLNYYNEQSHPIVLAFFELSDPNDFKQILSDKEKVAQLLDSSTSYNGIVSQLKITLHPGHSRKIKIDKVEKARYLGIVAGLFNMDDINSYVRLYEIDMHKEKSIFGVLSTVQKLSIDVELGRNGFTARQVGSSNES